MEFMGRWLLPDEYDAALDIRVDKAIGKHMDLFSAKSPYIIAQIERQLAVHGRVMARSEIKRWDDLQSEMKSLHTDIETKKKELNDFDKTVKVASSIYRTQLQLGSECVGRDRRRCFTLKPSKSARLSFTLNVTPRSKI
jgi:hypothetical protein